MATSELCTSSKNDVVNKIESDLIDHLKSKMRGISNHLEDVAAEQQLAIKEFFALITEDYVQQLETAFSQGRDIMSLLSAQSKSIKDRTLDNDGFRPANPNE